MRPVDIVVQLCNAQTDDARDAIIRKAWQNDMEDFFVGLQMSCDPDLKFPLDRIPEIQDEDDGDPGSFDFNEFCIIVTQLSADGVTEKDAKDIVYDAAGRANITEWNLWYRRILLKSLQKFLPMERIALVIKELTA